MDIIPPLHTGTAPAPKGIVSQKLPFMVSTISDRRLADSHWHDYTQIWYTVSGSYTQTINGVKLQQTAGSAALIFPYTLHQMDSSQTDLENIRVICINIFEDLFGKNIMPYLPLTFSTAAFDRLLLMPFICLRGKAKEQADILCEEILREYERKWQMDQRSVFDRIGKLLELFAITATVPISSVKLMRIYEQTAVIAEVTAYISEKANQSISLNQISRYAAMSQRSFCDKFKESTGQTFYSYHNRSRMAKVIRQLRFTGKSLTEIAEECGFYDLSHFVHTFKENFGMTPGVMREQMLVRCRTYGEYFRVCRIENIGWMELLNEEETKLYHDHSVEIIDR